MPQATFNDLEALEISIAIEERGETFYKVAAKKMEDKGIRAMLEELAEQERDHAETFRQLYNDAQSSKGSFDDDYIFDPDVSAYLRAMVSTSVFPSKEKQEKIIDKLDNVVDVLEIGIQAEKDSILFYTEMVIYSKLVEAKEAFRKLIKEEKKHLVDLQSKLNEYIK